jgi:PAS domain-containing protein
MRQQERIQGRQGLQLNKQSLQILVETIPALMWRAAPDGQIDYVNKRLLEYFGSLRARCCSHFCSLVLRALPRWRSFTSSRC